jgi:hypothetical protein
MLDVLHKYPITTLCAPPTVYRQLVTTQMQSYFASHSPKALEHCVGAGEPLNGEVIKVWKAMSGIDIRDGQFDPHLHSLCTRLADPSSSAQDTARLKPSLLRATVATWK